MGAELSQEDQDFLDSFETQLEGSNVEDPQEPTEPIEPTPEEIPTGHQPFDDGEEIPEEIPQAFEVDPDEARRLYEAVMAQPIKANGKEIHFKNVDEVIRATQMGLNYTKKMQELAKYKRTIATLEQNGVKTDTDVQFLLDLKNKNPQAIAKYFKESGVDPYDIDTSAEVDYNPHTKMVSAKELEADEVLAELKTLPNGPSFLKLIADTWDGPSVAELYNSPEGFRLLYQQREGGIFDKVLEEVERLTTLGELPSGLNTLQAYNFVGNQMWTNQQEQVQQPNTTVASSSGSTRSNKRAAASTPRSSKRNQSVALDDLLNLDDDTFVQAMKNRL